MQSLAFTSLVSRSFSVINNNASAPVSSMISAEVKNSLSITSDLILFPIIIICFSLFVLCLIAYFTSRVIKSRQYNKDRSHPGLRPFSLSRDAARTEPYDIEKGIRHAHSCGIQKTISAPVLLYGTGFAVLDECSVNNTKNLGEMDITDALSEHCDTSIVYEKAQLGALNNSKADASPRITVKAGSSSILLDTLNNEPHRAALGKRDVVVISDDRGIHGAGLTKKDIDSLRNSDDSTNDDNIPIRAAALAILSEKFRAFKSLGEEAYHTLLEKGVCDEPSSFASLSSSYSSFDIHELDTSATFFEESICEPIFSPTSPISRGVLGPYHPFSGARGMAQTTLFDRRSELQKNPDLCNYIPDPVPRRSLSLLDCATSPAYYRPEPMLLESALKEERTVETKWTSTMNKPIVSSPLASGIVIFPSSTDLTQESEREIATSSMVQLSYTPSSPGCPSIISDSDSSSELLVGVLHRMHRIASCSTIDLSIGEDRNPFANDPGTESCVFFDIDPGPLFFDQGSTVTSAPREPGGRVDKKAIAISSPAPVAPSLRETHAIDKAGLKSPSLPMIFQIGDEKMSPSSRCSRMPTVAEESEADYSSPSFYSSSPPPKISSGVLSSAAPTVTRPAASGSSRVKNRTTTRGDAYSPFGARHRSSYLRHIPRIPRICSTTDEKSTVSPTATTSRSRVRLGPPIVGHPLRKPSLISTARWVECSQDAPGDWIASPRFSKASRAKRRGLSDVSNILPGARSGKYPPTCSSLVGRLVSSTISRTPIKSVSH